MLHTIEFRHFLIILENFYISTIKTIIKRPSMLDKRLDKQTKMQINCT